jgi:hypothetical protein
VSARPLVLLAACAMSVCGCDFFAPVVSTFPAPGHTEGMCDAPPGCDQLDVLPPAVPLTAALAEDGCAGRERTSRLVRVTDDTSIDAEQLACVDLTIEVDAVDDGVRTVTLRGLALESAHVRIHSEEQVVALRIELLRVDQSELRIEGPIATTFDEVDTVGSRILLEAPTPTLAPQLSFEAGALRDVEILGPRAALRTRSTFVQGAAIQVGSLVMDRGQFVQVSIEADLIEMLDSDLRLADVRVNRLVAATGMLQSVHLARCGSVSLSQLSLVRSFVERCDEPLDLRDVAIEYSAVLADVGGRGGAIRHSAFGGARAALERGEITDSSLCGTTSVDVGTLTCVRCDPGAPPDICGRVSVAEPFCPGLCASVCSLSGAPALPPEVCAP